MPEVTLGNGPRRLYAQNATRMASFATEAAKRPDGIYRGQSYVYWTENAAVYREMAETGKPSEALKKTLRLVGIPC